MVARKVAGSCFGMQSIRRLHSGTPTDNQQLLEWHCGCDNGINTELTLNHSPCVMTRTSECSECRHLHDWRRFLRITQALGKRARQTPVAAGGGVGRSGLCLRLQEPLHDLLCACGVWCVCTCRGRCVQLRIA